MGRARSLYDTAEEVLLSKGALGLGLGVGLVSEPKQGIPELGQFSCVKPSAVKNRAFAWPTGWSGERG